MKFELSSLLFTTYLNLAYKFDILKKTQEQKNSKLKEKTQGLDKIDADKE